jgi:hypothetical protein
VIHYGHHLHLRWGDGGDIERSCLDLGDDHVFAVMSVPWLRGHHGPPYQKKRHHQTHGDLRVETMQE